MNYRERMICRDIYNKCERLRAKDRQWSSHLPLGKWLKASEAAAIWNVCRQEACKRLRYMKDSGMMEQEGTGTKAFWRLLKCR